MPGPDEFLDQLLQCPHCGTIRLRIPKDATGTTIITCSDCGEPIATWDDVLTSFEKQGGLSGVFRLARGKIRRLK
ncbi:MAG: hypothetical protein BGN87_13065 [Rhizobiales bacterium 65-79]|jgi:hypothetical protein|nr:hypothetical protein [Hyphomicrobiales bacterium]OJU06193.1 MAG: hypothetical protein BGN87_13065 [Rhizobiales bacterium 65-79]